jgi:tripartite-type tricarboxylate transporter receptor subunit TctC
MKNKLSSLIMGMLLCVILPANAQSEKNIKLLVPFPAGGSTDIVARIVAAGLEKRINRTVIIENRVGGGGAIATRELARATSDGRTIGVSTVSTFASNMAFQENIGYDPIEDFDHVMIFAYTPKVMVVRSDFPGKTSSEIVRNLSTGKINIGVSAQSYDEIYAHVFRQKVNNPNISIIRYKGGGPALIDLLGGHIDVVIENLPSMTSHLNDRRIKLVGISWPERFPDFPTVSTWKELGISEINDGTWYGIVAPKNISQIDLNNLYRELENVLSDPEIQKKLIERGAYPKIHSPEHSTEIVRQTLKKVQTLAKENQIGRYQK